MRVHRAAIVNPKVNSAAADRLSRGGAVAHDGVGETRDVRDVVGDESGVKCGAGLDLERGLDLALDAQKQLQWWSAIRCRNNRYKLLARSK
jgi:hypothetical protein